jgi:replication factor A1
VPYDVSGERDLIDLEPGDRGRTVDVKVVEVESKTIDGRDGETEILSGVRGDATARLPFTDWDPHAEIAEGESVRLEDVYIREYRGVPSVNVTEFSTVEPISGVEVSDSATRMTVGEAVDAGGVFDVELVGHVLGVRDGSGLIQRCPECSRVIQKGQCRSHGEVEGVDDLRTRAIVDDGTATVTATLDDELTAEIYGGDLEDALEAAREAMDQSVVADEIAAAIVGREFQLRGNLSVDDYGANLTATDFVAVDDDPAERATALLEAVR